MKTTRTCREGDRRANLRDLISIQEERKRAKGKRQEYGDASSRMRKKKTHLSVESANEQRL